MNAEDKKKIKDIGKEIADTFFKIKNVIIYFGRVFVQLF